MNDQKITKLLKNVLFKNYLSDISEAQPCRVVFQRKIYLSFGQEISEPVDLILIGNLSKWCELRQSNNLN